MWYKKPVYELSAFILAGGKSSRMGSNKAFLSLGGKMLIEHALRRLKPLDCDVFIVGPKADFNPFGRVLEDKFVDAGPLAGIHRALERSESSFIVITAIDTPLVTTEFLQSLVVVAKTDPAEAVIAHTASGYQPLCGVYRKEFLPAVESALNAGERKVDRVIFARPHRIVEADDSMFLNVNTPAEFAEAEKIYKQAKAAQP